MLSWIYSMKQYYQYLMCKKDDTEDQVLKVRTAADAKAATQALSPEKLDIWKEHSYKAINMYVYP